MRNNKNKLLSLSRSRSSQMTFPSMLPPLIFSSLSASKKCIKIQKQTEAPTKSSALKIHKCPIPTSVDDTSFTQPSSRYGLCSTVVDIRAAFSPYGVCRTILDVRHLPYTSRRWSLYNHRRTAFAVHFSTYGIRRTIIAIQFSTRRTVLDMRHFAVQCSSYGVHRTKLVVRRSPHKARRTAFAVLTSTHGMCAAHFPPYGVVLLPISSRHT